MTEHKKLKQGNNIAYACSHKALTKEQSRRPKNTHMWHSFLSYDDEILLFVVFIILIDHTFLRNILNFSNRYCEHNVLIRSDTARRSNPPPLCLFAVLGPFF